MRKTLDTMFYSTRDYSDIHSVDLSTDKDGKLDIVEIPYTGIVDLLSKPVILGNVVAHGETVGDYLHDYLMCYDRKVAFIYEDNYVEEARQELLGLGVEKEWLDPDNWIELKVTYLPFLHFIYRPKGWIV